MKLFFSQRAFLDFCNENKSFWLSFFPFVLGSFESAFSASVVSFPLNACDCFECCEVCKSLSWGNREEREPNPVETTSLLSLCMSIKLHVMDGEVAKEWGLWWWLRLAY